MLNSIDKLCGEDTVIFLAHQKRSRHNIDFFEMLESNGFEVMKICVEDIFSENSIIKGLFVVVTEFPAAK